MLRSYWWIFLFVLTGLVITGCTVAAPPISTPTLPASGAPVQSTAAATPTVRPAATAAFVSPSPSNTAEVQMPPADPALTEKLIQAAEAGDTPAVVQLLAQGADRNGRDARGRTPLMAATHGNRVDSVRALIAAGADINLQDERRDNPLLYASAEGQLEIVRLAIGAGADPTLTNRFGGTALIPAADRGHVEIVTELLTSTEIDVNHINHLGWTALLEAVILGDGGERHQRIVQLLIDHGANTQIADKNGVTPLEHARQRRFSEIERLLVQADTRQADLDLQLIVAASLGDVTQIQRLLGAGASVHARDGKGQTALVAAAYRNDLTIADALIRAGADVNAKDNTQQSAYLIATSEGYLELLHLTLQAGADVHSLDSYNGTGLIRAADRGHVEIIRELLKTDIKIDHINNLGWTALLEAIILGDGSQRYVDAVRLLVEAGANVNLADGNGVSPLAHARQRRYERIMDILRQAGARQ